MEFILCTSKLIVTSKSEALVMCDCTVFMDGVTIEYDQIHPRRTIYLQYFDSGAPVALFDASATDRARQNTTPCSHYLPSPLERMTLSGSILADNTTRTITSYHHTQQM